MVTCFHFLKITAHIKVMKMLLQEVSLQILKSVINDDVLDRTHNPVKRRLHLLIQKVKISGKKDPQNGPFNQAKAVSTCSSKK